MSDVYLNDDLFYVFYDGACSVCSREIAWMRRRSERENVSSIVWMDIAAQDFDAQKYGRTFEDFYSRMHVYSHGEFFVAMDAVRELYCKLGMGKYVAWTKLPFLRSFCNIAYAIFAYFRPRFTKCSVKNGSCHIK